MFSHKKLWKNKIMDRKPNAPWTEKYQITSLLVNPQGKLGLYGTLNLIQETAWMHAEHLGFGMADMEKEGLFWVLTRQVLQMRKWPLFGQTITIQTWLRPPEGAFVTRDFALLDDKGEEIGLCSTSWLALDRATKKILPAQNLRPWQDITLERSSGLVPQKIAVEGSYEKRAKYRVRNSDLDINQHVNNTKYAQWILDSIPFEFHKALLLKTYSVNFLAETHLGDEVVVEQSLTSSDARQENRGVSSYRGVRAADGKILFTVLLEWERK
ncbi:thioesterase [Bdellovibrio sp. 22V]|uniref:acyl-[acyl-carrier-protein] thioesterase n=1 Tax=Bdellovibrio TaxID=958 RepID=UPI0025431452|nr:acyl-ACP thioesterase domain-containing protein [Bdellovibrio sp. 22V]WII73730.1 thioesterase [Bdellovibrio sp. 22V]